MVQFELTVASADGTRRTVRSGYFPHYRVRSDYLTSVLHQFIDAEEVSTGETARANVWFLTPEAYPGCLWVGRVLEVAESTNIVGSATIVTIMNGTLQKQAQ